jgi:hypothetical protein
MSCHQELSKKQEKERHRAERAAHRAKKLPGYVAPTVTDPNGPVDCACVIHGNGYAWDYVEKLHSMLSRHLSRGVRLHVYTEPSRSVPAHMVRHDLTEWSGISGRKRSWWYKMQMFNPVHHQGQLLYFDLDTVIVDNIDWIVDLSPFYFWTIRDFRVLWKPDIQNMNSSVMYWDTTKWSHVWSNFEKNGTSKIISRYHHGGDQEYLTSVIAPEKRQFMDSNRIVSWRWTALDGGMNFKNRTYHRPGRGTILEPSNSVLVFHGDPKPHETTDVVIKQHWR